MEVIKLNRRRFQQIINSGLRLWKLNFTIEVIKLNRIRFHQIIDSGLWKLNLYNIIDEVCTD